MLDYNVDDNAFDSFVQSKRLNSGREMQIQNQYAPHMHLDDNRDVNVPSKINERRMKIQSHNKNLLSRMREASFFHNRHNHKVAYDNCKKMAIEIDDLHKKLAQSESNKNVCPHCKQRRIKKEKHSNFIDVSQNGNKVWLLGGVLVIGFLLFTPYGKNILK
jgi:hypothetical protein